MEAIKGFLQPAVGDQIRRLTLLAETDSTNDYLLQLPTADMHGQIVLAEKQNAGKGRRGRRWQSPQGNIFLSMGWRFNTRAVSLEGLSAVVGICTCRALSGIGLSGHGIKWPNDIYVDGAKLAGILVELKGNSHGTSAVIGVGINMHLDAETTSNIDQPATGLAGQSGLKTTDRNTIVAAVIEEIIAALEHGSRRLPDYLREHWSQWDLLAGQAVHLEYQGAAYKGEAQGITPGGALRLHVSSGPGSAAEIMTFHSAEVSVRRA